MKHHNQKIRGQRHRLPREAYRGFVNVNLTACIQNRIQVFTQQSIVKKMVSYLGDSAQAFDCTVPIYCFMPDHLHLILSGNSEAADAWSAFVHYKQRSGYWLEQASSQAQWQRSFYDRILRNNETLQDAVAYIARNPVRAGLVKNWNDYPFTGSIGWNLSEIMLADR